MNRSSRLTLSGAAFIVLAQMSIACMPEGFVTVERLYVSPLFAAGLLLIMLAWAFAAKD